jgi:hypothetical protein
MSRRRIGWLVLFILGASGVAAPSDLLVMLEDTGETREDLPVLRVHVGSEEIETVLHRGLSATLLRVYRSSQLYLERKEGISPEPAYLLLSDRQGGFAREGFFLGERNMSHAGYVDLHRSWPPAGRFGAVDQLFPHELAHVIRLQLAGPLADGGANQVHALGLRTDRATAFNEGFAEHFQAMAIDDPDADPATRALVDDRARLESVDRHLAQYRRELVSRVSIASRMRMGFLAWYSNDEDVLRYHGVKANAFSRQPEIPERLLAGGDPYPAYLLENIFPAAPNDSPKTLSRIISTEGVVSTLFYRWATSREIRESYREESFYRQFGVSREDVTPLENVYLKLVHALYVSKPQDVLQMIDGYCRLFEDESDAVQALASEVFGSSLDAPDEIWLANPQFVTGTTLFDQFRGLPRTHTFDLNAASAVDLTGVPGVDLALARRLIDAAPFDSIRDLGKVEGVDSGLIAGFEAMVTEMERLRAETKQQSVEDVISIRSILMPFVWRLLATLAGAAVIAAWIQRRVRSGGPSGGPAFAWWRSMINGVAAATLGLVAGWMTSAAGIGSIVAVCVLCGGPAAVLCLWKTRRRDDALRVLVAWFLTALPIALVVSPM